MTTKLRLVLQLRSLILYYFDQFRYFPAASSYNDVARSNLITIEGKHQFL